MISFWRIFCLELTALVRTRTVALLLLVSAAWMFLLPSVVTGDGTPDGARELYIRYSVGGVFALLLIALLASATGSLARERAARRLQLTMVRPVRYFAIALGKILAHVAVGAAVLAVAFAILACRTDLTRPCNHVLKPILPTPREEAVRMYDAFMADPATPERVRHARKSVVLRLLENRAVDNYQTIATNDTATWRFASPGEAIRLRFTNHLEMRQDVRGTFLSGGATLAVSNVTQAIVTLPFRGESPELVFRNTGTSALMIRPRRDLELLVRADAFLPNMLRAYLMMVAVIAFVVSVALLLGAGLARPVALFVAIVTLIVGEMSPSVVEQYPDELETKLTDRIGLTITRFAATVTRPLSDLSPMESLAKDECVEWKAVLPLLAIDLVLAPFILSLLAAFILPRKEDNDQ